MRDFQFFKGKGFWSYKQACELANAEGVVPIEDPEEMLVDQFRQVIKECLFKVKVKIPDELTLKGFFLFRAKDQESDDTRMAFALTCSDDGEAVIGLSEELLTLTRPEFWKIVFFHETAHLCGSNGHNEAFQEWLNNIMLQAYGMKEARGDDAETLQRVYNTMIFNGWKM